MAKPIYQMVHYRKLQQIDAKVIAPSLERMCRNALSATDQSSLPLWERARDHVFTYPAPEDRQILLTRVADLKSAVFGEMCLVQAKDLQALIELKARKEQLSDLTIAEIYALSERSAPQGSQFLRGLLYWLAIGDHLFFVKINVITPIHMQDYFTWLLQPAASGLPKGSAVTFQAEFDPSVVKGDVGDIRNLRVSGKTAPNFSVTPPQSDKKETMVETTKRVADKFLQSAMALPVV